MPQLREYTGKILSSTVDAKIIHDFMKNNELKITGSPMITGSPIEIIRIRTYSFRLPLADPKPSNLDVDLLNYNDPIAILNIYAKDLIKFGSYSRLEPQNGYTILCSHEDGRIVRIGKDNYKPILPIRHYLSKMMPIRNIILQPITLGILGIIVTLLLR